MRGGTPHTPSSTIMVLTSPHCSSWFHIRFKSQLGNPGALTFHEAIIATYMSLRQKLHVPSLFFQRFFSFLETPLSFSISRMVFTTEQLGAPIYSSSTSVLSYIAGLCLAQKMGVCGLSTLKGDLNLSRREEASCRAQSRKSNSLFALWDQGQMLCSIHYSSRLFCR